MQGHTGLRTYQCRLQPGTVQLDTRDRRSQLPTQTSLSPPTDLHASHNIAPLARAHLTHKRGRRNMCAHVYHLSSPIREGSFAFRISEFPYCLAPLEMQVRWPFLYRKPPVAQSIHPRVLCNQARRSNFVLFIPFSLYICK